MTVNLKSCFRYSNNMLYPKEDKENKVLLYAVSMLYKVRGVNLLSAGYC
jgi:hypothetical protein